jgi:four helix bundle protein
LDNSGETLRSSRKTILVRLPDRQGGAVSAHTRAPATALSYQVLKSGTSAGANYEEADDGSSDRDSLAKKRIVLRELKETLWRLRVVRASGFLSGVHDQVLAENDELVRIVATVIRNSSGRDNDASS